jgi:hypothetical protein
MCSQPYTLWEKLKPFSLKSGIQRCPLPPFIHILVLEILDRGIRQEKEIKGIQIWKGKRKIMPICR